MGQGRLVAEARQHGQAKLSVVVAVRLRRAIEAREAINRQIDASLAPFRRKAD